MKVNTFLKSPRYALSNSTPLEQFVKKTEEDLISFK